MLVGVDPWQEASDVVQLRKVNGGLVNLYLEAGYKFTFVNAVVVLPSCWSTRWHYLSTFVLIHDPFKISQQFASQ